MGPRPRRAAKRSHRSTAGFSEAFNWQKRIPVQAEELWQWLLDQDQTVVIELLAFCIGQTVYAVRLPHDVRTAPRFVAADQLAKAVNLDMADWWTPTGETYLGRVKKEQILEAICE